MPALQDTFLLPRLPANFKYADIICDFCGFLAQVKTASVSDPLSPPSSLPGASWEPQRKRMRTSPAHKRGEGRTLIRWPFGNNARRPPRNRGGLSESARGYQSRLAVERLDPSPAVRPGRRRSPDRHVAHHVAEAELIGFESRFIQVHHCSIRHRGHIHDQIRHRER